ncbi:MAG: hypothetical protein HQK96_09430, partial [Nitrospirae bacterium]|nr:hypothetical protein [Nitrospirota bacterium]
MDVTEPQIKTINGTIRVFDYLPVNYVMGTIITTTNNQIIVTNVMFVNISCVYPNQKPDEIEIRRIPEEQFTTEPYLIIDNSIAYTQAREGIVMGNFSEEFPFYKNISSGTQTFKATMLFKPVTAHDYLRLENAEMEKWQRYIIESIKNLTDLSIDILDIIFSLWIEKAKHSESTITITVDDILRIRGLREHKAGSGKRGGYREEDRMLISEQIDLLANIWISIAEYEVTTENEKNKQKKRTKLSFETRYIVVSSRVRQESSSGEYTLGWTIRPGDVFAKILTGPSRQTALLPRATVGYDYYRCSWEKRLSRYLSSIWRIRQK